MFHPPRLIRWALAAGLGVLIAAPSPAEVLTLIHVHDRIVQGGTFDGALIVASRNVQLIGVTFRCGALPSSNAQCIRIVQSSGVSIESGTVAADPATNGVAFDAINPDASGNVIGLPAGKCINIESSSGVTVRGVDISGCAKGVTFSAVPGLVLDGNRIHDLRTTPISGVPGDGTRIIGNRTWGNHPWRFGNDRKDGGADGDHGAGIHAFVRVGGKPVRGLVIAGNNLAVAGMLGIEIDDNGFSIGFPGIDVSRNTITGHHGGGITLENTSGTVTGNNMVWDAAGRQWNDAPRITPSDKSHDLTISGTLANYTRPRVDLTSKSLTPAGRASIKVVP